MEEKLLTELFDYNFGMLLKEEMSIANDVYIVSRDISIMLRKEIEKAKTKPYNKDGITYKCGMFVYPFDFDKELGIKWDYYNFISEKAFEREYGKIEYKNSFNKAGDTINITVFAIGGNIDAHSLEDTIMHEVEHKYQSSKSGKELLKTDRDKVAYSNAAINKLNNRNRAIKAIGNIFYYSKKFEQDAQVNGAYAYMMKRYEEENIQPSLTYKETEAYAVLKKLKMDINYCINNVNEYNKKTVDMYVKQIYGDYTIDKIVSLGNKTIERLSKKLMKVCTKAQIDIQRKEDKENEGKLIYYK